MADKTALLESAQALFCSIADYIGVKRTNLLFDPKKYPDYTDFRSQINEATLQAAHKNIETPGVFLNELELFLKKDTKWYISSLQIAKKLINDITKIDPDFKISAQGFQQIFYYRGDKEIMGTIEKLFKIANKSGYKSQNKFGNLNKWNPADIYLATKKAKKALKEELKGAKEKVYGFQNLNIITSDLIDSGDLFPLSLKKTTKEATLQMVNFDRKAEIKLIKTISIKGVTDWQLYKKVKYPTKGVTRDMRILLESGGDIKLRHDPSAKRFVAEAIFSKAEARGGSIGSMKVLSEIIHFVNPDIAKQILDKYKKGEQKYFDALKKIEYLRKDKPRFDYERGAISAIYVVNEVMPVLKKFFQDNRKDEGNKVLRLMFEYITSRTPLSGKFVIAK
jgi:hypothetical protein|tara:strand:+ start:181 stop:1359 length:1179 start_codon:yes stop_codon:yes gene_type:complete